MATSNLPELDRDKYIRILNAEGLSQAITQLHKDMWEIEFDTFEGREGYKPEQFELLKEFRNFSLELWELNQTIQQSAHDPNS